jgi:hypothetical protein
MSSVNPADKLNDLSHRIIGIAIEGEVKELKHRVDQIERRSVS